MTVFKIILEVFHLQKSNRMADEENKDVLEGEEEEQDPEKNEDDQYPNTDSKMRENVRQTFQTMDKEI